MKLKLIKVIVLFFMLQIVFVTSGYSEGNSDEVVNFSVSSATGNIGDEVTIEINLNNSSNFVSSNLVLNYNTKHLEYISYSNGEVLEKGAMSIVKNNSETGKISIGYISEASEEPSIIQAGNILKIVFKITSDFENETQLELDVASLKTREGKDITSTITNGKIEEKENKDNKNQDDSSNEITNKPVKPTAPTEIPKAGVSEKIIFIIILTILASVIIYYKNKSMKEIV